MNVREYLELANADRIRPEQLFDFFAMKVSRLVVLYQKSESGKKPILTKGNKPTSKFIAVFTDLEAARNVQLQQPQYVEIVEEVALPFLIKAYRSDADGIVFNPGLSSRLFMVKHHLLNLLREYAVQKCSELPGPWVPTMDQHLLLVEYQKGLYTVAIYTNESDAKFISRKSGGVVVQQPWEVIFERCRQLGSPAPYLHFGLPEQTHLLHHHAEKILKGKRSGYIELQAITHSFEARLSAVRADEPSHQEQIHPDEQQGQATNRENNKTIPFNQGQEKTNKRKNPYSKKHQSKPESDVYAGAKEAVQPGDRLIRSAKEEKLKPRLSKPMVANDASVQKQLSSTHNYRPSETPKSSPVHRSVIQQPIDPIVESTLQRLEKATVEGQGMANGWEVCRALAEVKRIWVVVDPDGNMVILAGQDQSPIVDFFTSAHHAQVLIDEAHQKNPSLPTMSPRLVSAKKLYKALAPRQPIVWINRGSPEAWTSIMGDTLPYVLQLMAQLEKEKM